MRFQTIVAPTITELFERQIQGMILSGQVEPGEKLPTEAELAENMHISKSAVHAGIKNLERMGFLRVSPRHGVYVADWAECGNVDTLISILKYRDGKLDKATTASLLQTRNVIEGLAVRLFVPKRTDDDIAVLRTLGAKDGLIRAIFVWYGLLAGSVGSLFGVVIGVICALNLTSIINGIEYLIGHKFLSGDIYFIDFLPSELHWLDVFYVLVTALLLSLLASWYPARRASRIDPARVLSGQ